MSAFVGEGFGSFPNIHSDIKELSKIVEWSDEVLDHKAAQYGAFLQCADLMPRARRSANFIIDRILFDLACRDGIYDINLSKLEDETCV